ncbi:MAG: bifunctional DNA-formamidopyrimidine glycosylase/DNA-(apurinic or apyrimidinic site) lyase [Candidatus Delongbacteria bacterium]|nr:bifunctional DNA-formamidopyrimidine glycosylase/DNA-(apurinic or apyrimidinic site) lyase [Candidatus Delongbacteria bacterium]
MPELPEVESIRRDLEPKLIGQTIVAVELRLAKLVSGHGSNRSGDPVKVSEFETGLLNQVFSRIDRAGKNLIFAFENGSRMLVHLKMTGGFRYYDEADLSGKETARHAHVVFRLGRGRLEYIDSRTFGFLLYYRSQSDLEESRILSSLGVDPLSDGFSREYWRQSISRSKMPLKSALLSQKLVAGIGNIYADEICFLSRIHPGCRGERLTRDQIDRLYEAIGEVLGKAIECRGSSIDTYRLPDGRPGSFADIHQVYGRAGQPCRVCGGELKKCILSQRTTVFCPDCQPLEPSNPAPFKSQALNRPGRKPGTSKRNRNEPA